MTIRVAVLDIAGTTVDEGGAVYTALAEASAVDGRQPGEELVQEWMGTDKREAIAALVASSAGETPDSDEVEQRYEDFRQRLVAAYAANPPQPFDGVEAMFGQLRGADIKVALTTGFARDVAEPLLASLGWTVGPGATIDALICADDVAAGRPAPYLIFRAMEATGVGSVAEVAVAGDTIADVNAGTNAGARIVAGVGTGKLELGELAEQPHTHLLDSVTQLPAVVAALALGG